jgi:hypothetical protein
MASAPPPSPSPAGNAGTPPPLAPVIEKPRKPALAKLVVGPTMALAEMSMLGHWMEMLKILKQSGVYNKTLADVGKEASYGQIARQLWREEGWLSLYRGFAPWGVIQCVKGVPVLFIQAESSFHLQKRGVDRHQAEIAAGFLGGAGQVIYLLFFSLSLSLCPFCRGLLDPLF